MLVVLCVAYLPIFAGQIVFLRDPAHWNYPARWFVRASLWRGDSPLWNPNVGLGFSVLANPLYGLFYPPNWLYLVAPESLVARLVTWQSLGHLLWGSAGAMCLASRLGASSVGASIAGLAWGLSGYTTASWTAGLLLLADSWIPWCGVGFVGLARAARGGGAGWLRCLAWAALPLGMALLLGEVFVAAMGAMLGLSVAGLALAFDGVLLDRRAWRRVLQGGAASLVLAAGLGAAAVLPAQALAQGTPRAVPIAKAAAEAFSFHPLRMIELVAAGAMGTGVGDYPGSAVVGEPTIGRLPLMHSAYAGASVVALAFLAFGRGRRLAAGIAALGAVALVVGMGQHTPLHAWFRAVVRPFAYMRFPEKYLAVFVVVVAVVAGLGASRLCADGATRRRAPVLLALLLALAAIAPWAFAPEWASHVVRGALHGAAAVGGVMAAQFLVARGRRGQGELMLVAVVAIDLATAAWPFLTFAPDAVATTRPRAAATVLEDARSGSDGPAPPRVYYAFGNEDSLQTFAPARSEVEAEAQRQQALVPNTAITFGVATVPGYDAAIPPAVADLWTAGRKMGQAVLRALAVRYAIMPVDPRAPERRAGLEPLVDPVGGTRLYRVPGALPRVYLAGRAEVSHDDLTLTRLLEPAVVSGDLALLAPDPAAPTLSTNAARAGSCTLVQFSNVALTVRCHAERPAIAVIVEQHDRGWSATVDGRPAPLLRANLLLRGVALDTGHHTIALSYAARGLRLGVGLSLLSMALCLILLAVATVQARRRAG